MKKPQISDSAFVASSATLIGDITLGEHTSVLFGAIVRADHAPIIVGDGSNIQDNCILHEEHNTPLVIGKDCTVGHGAILHGCTIGDNTLIGMGATVLNGAKIGQNCIVGAGALVTGKTVVPDGCMVLGSPAKVKRLLTEEEIAHNRKSARIYQEECAEYKKQQEACGMTLFVKYYCKPGMREPFVRTVVERGILDAVRNEEGCFAYDYYFSAQDENILLLIEKWRSPEDQKVHLTLPHMKELASFKDEFVEKTVLGEDAL